MGSATRLVLLVLVSLCAQLSWARLAVDSPALNVTEFFQNDVPVWYSACDDGHGGLALVEGKRTDCAAQGWFIDKIDTTGWSYIYVHSTPTFTIMQQSLAAGFLEGALTATRIAQYFSNSFYIYNQSSDPLMADTLNKFLQKNLDWMNMQVVAHPDDVYWVAVDLILQQLNGLVAGYTSAQLLAVPAPVRPSPGPGPGKSLPSLALLDFIMMNIAGDYEDITGALKRNQSADVKAYDQLWKNYTMAEIRDKVDTRARCSAMVKMVLAADCAKPARRHTVTAPPEVIMGHTTWSTFSSMIRIFKYYDVVTTAADGSTNGPYSELYNSGAVHFSSYPGTVTSVDDFFMLKRSRLAVIETTNELIDTKLYKYVTPESLLTWMRGPVSNRMATDGMSWGNLFKQFNSGTYNNQWMIVNYKLVTEKRADMCSLPDTALFIVSQMPGDVFMQDVTSYLNTQSFWPSFNRPFFPAIYEGFGYADAAKKYGDYWFSYDAYFRNLMMIRDQVDIKSELEMRALITSNDYKNDPYSKDWAGNALSARNDLQKKSPFPDLSWFSPGAHGGIDAKVTSTTLFSKMSAQAQSGPTHTSLPPFTWSGDWSYIHHDGQPNTFDFDFQLFTEPTAFM